MRAERLLTVLTRSSMPTPHRARQRCSAEAERQNRIRGAVSTTAVTVAEAAISAMRMRRGA